MLDRAAFPLLDEVSYLNSAGLGLVPAPVQRITQNFIGSLGTQGTLRFFAESDRILRDPRVKAAPVFGANPADIAIVTSASEAISQIAAWRQPKAGENVVLIDIDHPSPTLPWLRWAQSGCEIRWVRVSEDPTALSLDSIARLVDRNTAAISLSHVQWTTGYRFDLSALGALAAAHDALLVVDATHSAGVVPIDGPGSGAHLIVTGSFKWLCAYSGTGICYLRPDVAAQLRPAMVGSRTSHGDASPIGTAIGDLDFPKGAQRLEYGSSAHILRVALAAAIDHMLAPGLNAIEHHAHRLGDRLIAGLDRLGANILTPREPTARAAIVTASFAGHDAQHLVQALEQRGVVTLPRLGGVRFAPHSFNDESDIDRAIETLSKILC